MLVKNIPQSIHCSEFTKILVNYCYDSHQRILFEGSIIKHFSQSDFRNSIADLFRLFSQSIFIFFFSVIVSVANLNLTKKVSLDYGQLLRLR